jgi:hypothetical protein
MKKMGRTLLLAQVLILIGGAIVNAGTTLQGTMGGYTTPGTNTPGKGVINISAGYIFDPGNLYTSITTAPIQNWELSAGKEIPTKEGSELGATPFILGTKYMFYGSKKNGFRAAVGAQVEILGKAAGLDGVPVTIYGVISESAGKLGYVNTGLGYTLGIDAGYQINFFFSLEKAIIGDKLYVIGEFTNYSVREGLYTPWSVDRGIFNTGLLLELNEFLSFKGMFYDLLDDFINVGLGAEVRIKAF